MRSLHNPLAREFYRKCKSWYRERLKFAAGIGSVWRPTGAYSEVEIALADRYGSEIFDRHCGAIRQVLLRLDNAALKEVSGGQY